ncbi:hypothetical protein [Synechococcus sp. M16CYN]|uniref:hypothetical protein n=1 Tax=Synechococcus sp. M16CYN TaxID=3103139 RepID=UPI0032433538
MCNSQVAEIDGATICLWRLQRRLHVIEIKGAPAEMTQYGLGLVKVTDQNRVKGKEFRVLDGFIIEELLFQLSSLLRLLRNASNLTSI